MRIATIVVSRSRSCHVKALHTVLRFNIKCMQSGIQNEVFFVNDDTFKKSEMIQTCMGTHDRVFFIDFGVGLDDQTLAKVVDPNIHGDVMVFPGAKEGINWDMFKQKVNDESTEPVEQMGLEFDTNVGSCIDGDIYKVDTTEAKTWVLASKPVLKKMRDKRTGKYKIPPKFDVMFEKFKEFGVKISAYVGAQVTNTYTHECFGNILNSSGVKST